MIGGRAVESHVDSASSGCRPPDFPPHSLFSHRERLQHTSVVENVSRITSTFPKCWQNVLGHISPRIRDPKKIRQRPLGDDVPYFCRPTRIEPEVGASCQPKLSTLSLMKKPLFLFILRFSKLPDEVDIPTDWKTLRSQSYLAEGGTMASMAGYQLCGLLFPDYRPRV